QQFNTVDKAYAAVKNFAHSNRFGIKKGHVKKDANNDYEISRTFLEIKELAKTEDMLNFDS
ncbi:15984_t:CDS:1, partial [Dentiscutata erythropus]